MARILVAVVVGNALGYGAWRAAWGVLPALWALPAERAGWLARMGLVALTAILLAAPPVLVGALAAWMARRAHLLVGLAGGLWALSLVQASPPELPFLTTFWFAPTVLILLSGALGGWMLDLQAQVGRAPQAGR
jgi:hypothetical protein